MQEYSTYQRFYNRGPLLDQGGSPVPVRLGVKDHRCFVVNDSQSSSYHVFTLDTGETGAVTRGDEPAPAVRPPSASPSDRLTDNRKTLRLYQGTCPGGVGGVRHITLPYIKINNYFAIALFISDLMRIIPNRDS
jgi:hypothetical protein